MVRDRSAHVSAFSGFTLTEGFTLAELLIVVMILGIAAVVVMPRFEMMAGQGEEGRATRLVAGAISRAQDLAIIRREPVTIALNLDEKTLNIAGDPAAIELPDVPLSFSSHPGMAGRTTGTVEISVDRFGGIDLFEIAIGSEYRGIANPVTGDIEKVER